MNPPANDQHDTQHDAESAPAEVALAETTALLDDPEQLANLVQEIKQRLNEVAARESDMERREAELAERVHQLADRAIHELPPAREAESRLPPADSHTQVRTEIAAETAELRRRRGELAQRIRSAREAIARRAARTETPRTETPRPEGAELAERRAAVDKLYLQASEIEQRARSRFEEAGQLREKLVEKAAQLKEYRRRLEAAQRAILTERARLKADRETHGLLESELTRRREAFELESLELGPTRSRTARPRSSSAARSSVATQRTSHSNAMS
jgi:hypothetical protein